MRRTQEGLTEVVRPKPRSHGGQAAAGRQASGEK